MARLSLFIGLVLLALTVSARRRPAHKPNKNHSSTTPATSTDSEDIVSTETSVPDGSNPASLNIPFPPFSLSPVTPAERNRHPKKRRGYKGKDQKQRSVLLIPPTFDARVQWPNCQTMKTIPNQGACGTCWAVNAASVLSDRFCIASGQAVTNIYMSANQAASCTARSTGQTPAQNCNDGGLPADVYQYAQATGIETGYQKYTDAGALIASPMGCVPYPVNPMGAALPLSCAMTGCTNAGYTAKTFANDKNKVANYFYDYEFYDYIANQNYAAMPIADRSTAVYEMQAEIMTNGPISAIFDVWTDFQAWAGGAPYNGPASGASYLGGHVLKLVGWNYMLIGGKNVSYWIGVNSWGNYPGRGIAGVYNVQMRQNVAGIESAWGAPYVSA